MTAIRHRNQKTGLVLSTLEQSEEIQTGQDCTMVFVKAVSIDIDAPMDSIYWFVNYVYDKSSAGVVGVERGWIVNKINGTA
jgi:hypothetical protein